MPKTPQLKATQIIKALKRLGYEIIRQKGSHIRLSDAKGRYVTVPNHSQPIAIGTLHSILDQAGISLEQLLERIK